MLYTIRLFFALLVCSLVAAGHPGLAQFVAKASPFPRTTHQAAQPQALSLRDVLNQFKTRYKVDILFEDRLIDDHLIESDMIDTAAPLEKNLTSLLKPKGLQFAKIRNGVYAVLADTRTRNIPLADDINRLSTPAILPKEQPESAQLIQLKTKELSPVAADQTINGRVTDGATGGGLPGVSVVVKGTSRGTTTDTDGNFRVTVPEQNATNTLDAGFLLHWLCYAGNSGGHQKHGERNDGHR